MTKISKAEAFGRTYAVLDALGARYYPKGKPRITKTYASRFETRPQYYFTEIHKEIIKMSHKFNPRDQDVFHRLTEYIGNIEPKDFNDEPLSGEELSEFYLHFYHEKSSLWKPNKEKA